MLPPLLRLQPHGATVFTACQHGTPEWHAVRARYQLTASTVPDVLGPGIGYRSRGKRYRLIKGIDKDDFTPYQADLMRQGTEREPEALSLLKECLPSRYHVKTPRGMFHNEYWPWLGCTPDGTFNHGEITGPLCPIEIKCPARTDELMMQWKKWLRWRVQLEVQMRCMAAPAGIMWVYHPVQSCMLFHCRPNDRLWTLIMRACTNFNEYVRTNTHPPRQVGDDDAWEQLVLKHTEFGAFYAATEKWDAEHLYFF